MTKLTLTLSLVSALSFGFAPVAQAEIVPKSQMRFYSNSSNEFSIMAGQLPQGLDPGIGFTATIAKPTGFTSLLRFERTLKYKTMTASGDGNVYVVKSGDVLSAATIAAKRYPLLMGSDLIRNTNPPALKVGRDFWLGVALKGVSSPYSSRPNAYGWLHMRFNALGTLEMLDNVMAYGEPGLVVGARTPCTVCQP